MRAYILTLNNMFLEEDYSDNKPVQAAFLEKDEALIQLIFRFDELEQDFESYIPDWTGGIINTFEYKGVSLYALIDFQKGGQFFSYSNSLGDAGGLLQETVENNDKGNPQRDPVDEGGGIRADGVLEDGPF